MAKKNSNKKQDSNFTKVYIGKGKQVQNFDIVRVSIKVEEAMKFVHDYENEQYITFEVARLQEPDQFGKTHTCYVSVKESKNTGDSQ